MSLSFEMISSWRSLYAWQPHLVEIFVMTATPRFSSLWPLHGNLTIGLLTFFVSGFLRSVFSELSCRRIPGFDYWRSHQGQVTSSDQHAPHSRLHWWFIQTPVRVMLHAVEGIKIYWINWIIIIRPHLMQCSNHNLTNFDFSLS